MDVGREYFRLLLWRSFFQDAEKDYWGDIWCKMHDLATSVAGTKSTILHSKGENIGENVRHVTFNHVDSTMQFPIHLLKGKRMQTVLGHSIEGRLHGLTSDVLVSNLKYLHDLRHLSLHTMPSSIEKLKHLRYLDVSENQYIKILPNSTVMLLNLQTLNFKNCLSLRELPRDTKNIVNLRHLNITGCIKLTHMLHRLGNLTFLEILPCFLMKKGGFKATSSAGVSELRELSNLGGSLMLCNIGHGKDDMTECKAANMKEKQHLHQQGLYWDTELVVETECYDDIGQPLSKHWATLHTFFSLITTSMGHCVMDG